MKTNTYFQSLKVVVIGGTGLIGAQVVTRLHALGHQAVAASPSKGINAFTGEGLHDVMLGADVVVDVSNAPSFEDAPALDFFTTSTRNILAAEAAAGVKHHVALSVVGTDLMQEAGYFRAKLAQELLIKKSSVPYTIVRATQFFEFVKSIAFAATQGNTTRLSSALMQPIFSADVADILTTLAVSAPRNGLVDIAGPEQIRMNELVGQWFAANAIANEIVVSEQAGYFGTPVNDRSLVPHGDAILGKVRFGQWLDQTVLQPR